MARLRKRRRRRRAQHIGEISLTPLIDTALTLLIIFMITTPMLQNAIKVELPKGSAEEAQQDKQELVVHIDKSGAIFFDGQVVTRKALNTCIDKRCGIAQDQTVFVKADKDINYGMVMEVVDQVKHIKGVKYVALATQKVTT